MKPEEILVCPRCGSKDISSLKHMRYFLKETAPLSGQIMCQDCGFEGLPLMVDSEKTRLKLVKGRRENKSRTSRER
jgi:hypothetical protein